MSLNNELNQVQYLFSEYLNYQRSESMNNLNELLMDSSSRCLKFSIRTLMVKIEPEVTEIHEFEYRHQSLYLTFVEFLEYHVHMTMKIVDNVSME